MGVGHEGSCGRISPCRTLLFYILVQILGTDASRNAPTVASFFRAKIWESLQSLLFARAIFTTGLLGVRSGFGHLWLMADVVM